MTGLKHRAVVFAYNASGVAAVLIRGLLAAVGNRDDIDLAAVCILAPRPFGRLFCRNLVSGAVFHAVISGRKRNGVSPSFPLPISLARLERKRGCAILVPPGGDINAPAFISRLRGEVGATMALSFFCPMKFGSELLGVFEHAVNYHNGFLPRYRGIHATAWSIYDGAAETGFVFHRMTPGLDEGPILLEGSLPISPKADSLALEFAKAETAAADLPRVLSMTVEGHPGKAQTGEVRYYSIKDSRNMTTIADPSFVSGDELERRLRAFRILRMQIGGEWLDVTRVRPVRKPGRFSFRTSNGEVWKAVRFHYLPYAAYRSVRHLLH